MADPNTTSNADLRAAAIAAAERRLGLASSPSSSANATPTSPDPTPKTLFKPWVRPTEREERVIRIKFARLVDREIVGGNSYAIAATCLETLLQITDNILKEPKDPKFRLMKDTSKALTSKVLNVRGGKEYLIEVGFRAKRENFALSYYLADTEANIFNLTVGRDIVTTSLKEAKHRAEASSSSHLANKQFEAARREAALRAIEADRESVHDRVERERIGREARAAKAAAEAAAAAEVDGTEREQGAMRDDTLENVRPGVTPSGRALAASSEETHDTDESEMDDDFQPAHEGFADDGNRLGD